MTALVRIGTRRSKLALTQSGMMQRAIGRALGVADADLLEAVPLVEIVTTGDRVQDLGHRGLHPGAVAGSKDDGKACAGHEWLRA